MKKLSKTQTISRSASFDKFPLISLKAPKKELLDQLKDACTRVGFFHIKDHGVPADKIEAFFSMAEKLFAQEKEVKNQINHKQSKILRGYEPPPTEVRTDENRKPDVNEAFNWDYEKELDPLWNDTEATADALGIGAHTGIELYTILAPGTVPALQILNTNGE
ncbi:unnamed protein product [Clonostachys rhizophaga]|uniref:Non-haem dioxygenase N-terminal domain-containing protein n=1 Tax=Clonostachys rhizophaga TaxID=160324 RepID=A0A9N9VRH4_9HYPO|nr:unnamed protein product [Clonostachys rhizophaga]